MERPPPPGAAARAPRVVLDTNVYVSAFVWGGLPAILIDHGRRKWIRLWTSSAIAGEVERVLQTKFLWTPEQLRGMRMFFERTASWVDPPQRVTVLSDTDEAANRILEAALAARADAIVSGDHHLLDLRAFRGIPILTPRQFLDRLAKRAA